MIHVFFVLCNNFSYKFLKQSPGLMSQLMDYRFDNMHRFVVLNLKLILCGIVMSRTPDCLPDAKGSDHMTKKNDGANVWVGYICGCRKKETKIKIL